MTTLERIRKEIEIYNNNLAAKLIDEIEAILIKNDGYCEIPIFNNTVRDIVFDRLLEEGFDLVDDAAKLKVTVPYEEEL